MTSYATKKCKSIIALASLFIVSITVGGRSVFAEHCPVDDEVCVNRHVGGIANPLDDINSISDFIVAIVNVVRDIGFFVAIFFIIYSGFLFVKARGNETELATAKKTFLWTLVGTAVLLGAWLIAQAIQGSVDNLSV